MATAAATALCDGRFQGEARRVVNRARLISRRMGAAIRRGSLNRHLLAGWKRQLDCYRRRGDWLSSLDFMLEYGPGIVTYCKPSRYDRGAA